MPLRPQPPDPDVIEWLEDQRRFDRNRVNARSTIHVQPLMKIKEDNAWCVVNLNDCQCYGMPNQVYSVGWNEEDERLWLSGDASFRKYGHTVEEAAGFMRMHGEWSRRRDHKNNVDFWKED